MVQLYVLKSRDPIMFQAKDKPFLLTKFDPSLKRRWSRFLVLVYCFGITAFANHVYTFHVSSQYSQQTSIVTTSHHKAHDTRAPGDPCFQCFVQSGHSLPELIHHVHYEGLLTHYPAFLVRSDPISIVHFLISMPTRAPPQHFAMS